jgi:integrase
MCAPIRDKEVLSSVIEYMMKDNRVLGMMAKLQATFGLRYSELKELKISDIESGYFNVWQQKVSKSRKVKINEEIMKVIVSFIGVRTGAVFDEIYTREHYAVLLKKYCSWFGLKVGEISTHSMRKSFGYHAHKAGVSVEKLMMVFGHSSPKITLIYIGFGQEEIDSVYDSLVF